MHFDAAVNHGVGTAIRSLQEAAGVEADGVIGPLTRRAIEAVSAVELIERYAAIRERRYRALSHFWRFGRGWLARVAATRTAALALEPGNRPASIKAAVTVPPAPPMPPPSPHPSQQGDPAMSDIKQQPAKWWGQSMTIWGALITAVSTVIPVLGPLIGLEISPEAVRQIGGELVAALQALAGVLGTLMTIYGRMRATQPLMRRDLNLRV
jgi:lysozyme family protein